MEADRRLKTNTLTDKVEETGENSSLSDFYFLLCFRYLVSICIVFPSGSFTARERLISTGAVGW